MCSTYNDFSERIDQLRSQYKTRIENDLKKYQEEKISTTNENGDDGNELMKHHYAKFDEIIASRVKLFQSKLSEHSAEYKMKFAELLSEEKQQQQTQSSVSSSSARTKEQQQQNTKESKDSVKTTTSVVRQQQQKQEVKKILKK